MVPARDPTRPPPASGGLEPERSRAGHATNSGKCSKKSDSCNLLRDSNSELNLIRERPEKPLDKEKPKWYEINNFDLRS